MLGVKVHPGVTFTELVKPSDKPAAGWSAAVSPVSSPLTSKHYDIILAADVKKNSLPGFHSKEFRAKLALAITCNIVRHSTRADFKDEMHYFVMTAKKQLAEEGSIERGKSQN